MPRSFSVNCCGSTNRRHQGPPPTHCLPNSCAGTIRSKPLDRTTRGLMVAFGDTRVRALTTVPGLETVITLKARDAFARRPTEGDSSPDDDIHAFGPGEGFEPDLAERLWRELSSQRVMARPRPSDRQLEWSGELMPFQKEGVQALIGMDRLLLSDDMGLGKTVQAIVALRILRAKGEIGSSLVVAPASVLDQWRRELVRWAPELSAIIVRGAAQDREWQWRASADVTLASYDVLRSDAGNLPKHRAFLGAWHVVVLDEAQRIKNRNDTSEAAKNIPRVRSWALTGTPIENHEEELASILEFVDHDEGEPRKRYWPGPALIRRHAELQLRRKKADVFERPSSQAGNQTEDPAQQGPAGELRQGRTRGNHLSAVPGRRNRCQPCAGTDHPSQADLQRRPQIGVIQQARRHCGTAVDSLGPGSQGAGLLAIQERCVGCGGCGPAPAGIQSPDPDRRCTAGPAFRPHQPVSRTARHTRS